MRKITVENVGMYIVTEVISSLKHEIAVIISMIILID